MDMLVAWHLEEGQFQNFRGFMQSDTVTVERKKIAQLSKAIGAVAPDQLKFMFKIAVHEAEALHALFDGSNPISKAVFDQVMEGYEIYSLREL